MERIARPMGLLLAAGALMSVSPPSQPTYSAELLAMLSPSAMASSLCGGGGGGAKSMRAALMVSAAVLQAAGTQEATTSPLYDGLGKVHFPITTSNPLAQRYFD